MGPPGAGAETSGGDLGIGLSGTMASGVGFVTIRGGGSTLTKDGGETKACPTASTEIGGTVA